MPHTEYAVDTWTHNTYCRPDKFYVCVCGWVVFFRCLYYINWPWIYAQNCFGFMLSTAFYSCSLLLSPPLSLLSRDFPKQLCICIRTRGTERTSVNDDNNCITVFPFIFPTLSETTLIFSFEDSFPFGSQTASVWYTRNMWVNEYEKKYGLKEVCDRMDRSTVNELNECFNWLCVSLICHAIQSIRFFSRSKQTTPR